MHRLSIPLVLLLAACGGEDGTTGDPMVDPDGNAPPAGDTYKLGLQKAGAVLTTRLVDALPAPPERGDNAWIIEVLRDETPLQGCTVTVKPDMPAHGHGTGDVKVTETGDGRYALEPLDLFMPGLWVTTIDLVCDDVTDAVEYAFWIEG